MSFLMTYYTGYSYEFLCLNISIHSRVKYRKKYVTAKFYPFPVKFLVTADMWNFLTEILAKRNKVWFVHWKKKSWTLKIL